MTREKEREQKKQYSPAGAGKVLCYLQGRLKIEHNLSSGIRFAYFSSLCYLIFSMKLSSNLQFISIQIRMGERKVIKFL